MGSYIPLESEKYYESIVSKIEKNLKIKKLQKWPIIFFCSDNTIVFPFLPPLYPLFTPFPFLYSIQELRHCLYNIIWYFHIIPFIVVYILYCKLFFQFCLQWIRNIFLILKVYMNPYFFTCEMIKLSSKFLFSWV